MVIQSGHQPTVLQQLCLLPFQYFSDPALVDILFPTLISCCYKNAENSAILEQEMSCELLAHFLEVSLLSHLFVYFCSLGIGNIVLTEKRGKALQMMSVREGQGKFFFVREKQGRIVTTVSMNSVLIGLFWSILLAR